MLSGCLNVTPTDQENETSRKSREGLPTISSTPEYSAVYDTFIERRNIGDCDEGACEDSMFVWDNDECSDLILRYWRSSLCAMSTLLIDFDTSDLPDSAVINDVNLKLYWNDGGSTTQGSQPSEQGCQPVGPNAGPILAVGSMYTSIESTTPGDSLTASKALPPIMLDDCPAEVFVVQPGQSFTTPGWVDIDVKEYVNVTGISRYALDRELATGYDLVEYTFDASEGRNGPRLEVEYEVSMRPCIDGRIDHMTTGCSSCAEQYFSDNTTSTTAYVVGDGTASDHCAKRNQTVLAFDTDELVDAHTISTATLTFYVSATTSQCVTTPRIEILVRNEESCPTGFDSDDFDDCGTYTSLGTVTVNSTGGYTFTIPSAESHINASGITQFVLVDATIYDSGFCAPKKQSFTISTSEHGTESQRPELSVVYD
jgi:hypothetical protein